MHVQQGVRPSQGPCRPGRSQAWHGGEQIAWSPDSTGLVYTAKVSDAPEFSTNSDLFWAPLAGGTHRNLTRGFGGYDVEPRFSPSG